MICLLPAGEGGLQKNIHILDLEIEQKFQVSKAPRRPATLFHLFYALSRLSPMSHLFLACSILYSLLIEHVSFLSLCPRGSQSVDSAPVGQSPPFRPSHWPPASPVQQTFALIHLRPVTYSDNRCCLQQDTAVRICVRSGWGADIQADLIYIFVF